MVSCSDGDFDVPEFDFDETVYSCDDYVLYVTSSSATETMVMTLVEDELGTEVGTFSYPITSTRKVVYRLFSDAVGSNYFCQLIPPTSPTVIEELDAESGEINIVTTEIIEEGVLTGYSYEISISDLLFIDGNERIYFENFVFGNYEIDVE